MALAVLAAAGPHGGQELRDERRAGRDIALVVDASESMAAVDLDEAKIALTQDAGFGNH